MRTDHEPEHGNHSRQCDIPRNDREKDHDLEEEYEEVEILPKHLTNCHREIFYNNLCYWCISHFL